MHMDLDDDKRFGEYILARPLEIPSRAHPEEILALSRSLITSTVLEALVLLREMAGPFLSFCDEMRVPDEGWTGMG